jgi:periplasmic protein TonB
MFEHSLIDLEPKKQSRRRWISLPVAVALHLVGLTAFAFASYWNVAEVPDQIASNDVYFVTLPLPELGGGGGGQQKQPEKPAERPQEEAVPPQQEIVQPDLKKTPEDVLPSTPTEPVLRDLTAIGPVGPFVPGSSNVGPGGPGIGDGPGGPGNGDGIIKGPGAGDGGDGLPVRFKVGGMTRPEIIHQVQPRYSEKARQVGIQGAVIVEAIIDEHGNVTNVRVLKGLPMGLEQAAVEAIQQWRFKPATQESTGKAVKVYYTLTVNFTIQR